MVFMLPIAVIVTVFTFTAIVHWTNMQRKEREAFYRAETLRRITEASGDGAKAALELMKEDERVRARKGREGLKIGGLINVAVGIGLGLAFRAMFGSGGGPITSGGTGSVYLCGLIPALIGVAMLVYVYMLAGPVE